MNGINNYRAINLRNYTINVIPVIFKKFNFSQRYIYIYIYALITEVSNSKIYLKKLISGN